MTAFCYSKNLELKSETLETAGSPFLPWKVDANLTALKWRCVYPYFCHEIINSLGSARVMKFSVSLASHLLYGMKRKAFLPMLDSPSQK